MTLTPRPRRLVSAWFPHLAMERWRRVASRHRTPLGDEVPVVLASDGTHGPVVHAASARAHALGVRPGRRVVDAQAIHPELHVEPADPGGDRAMLDRLALWSRRWCPWTVRDGADGLVLDVTGAAHLFGGEAAMLRDMARHFALQGLTARTAMAPSRGAAWALARYGAAGAICGAGDVAAHLAPLPVRALRLGEDEARLLDGLGLKTIGALAAVPRAALMRRFARIKADANPVLMLDRALGHRAEPLDAPPDPGRILVRAPLAEPVMDAAPHIPGLAARLVADLDRAGQGARALRLTVYRIDGEWRSADVATATATRDAGHVARLLAGKLDRVDPGFGFDLVTLEALRTEPLATEEPDLTGERDPEADLAQLVDRLTARLGRDRVTWSVWHESHRPERVEGAAPALIAAPSDPVPVASERPLRLLDRPEEVRVLYAVPEGPPQRFAWRRVVHDVVRREGPERIAPEWWRDRPGTRLRDYWKVEVADGRRFWLYREGVHGDGRGDDPRWFLHGFFA